MQEWAFRLPRSSKIRRLIEISKVRLDNRRIYIGGKSEIFGVTTYHPAQVIRVGRGHLYVQAVPASCFGFNLRGVESKARRERERVLCRGRHE